ncbi:MAG: hypothetical protein MUF51_06025, partial [Vicinamibacteria bacterium]|nr:hypothetical protein [Vicinamibacteria bacterium]
MPRPRVIAALLLLYLLIAILTSHPFSTRPGETLPDNADALAFSWAMSWVCHQIGTDPVHLLKANIYHPDPAPLAYGEPMLGEALLACPVYAVTKNDVVTFNVTFVLTLTLAAFTMFLLSYEVTGHLGASILAGEIFSFTTANYESAARIQIVSNQWTPLALFFLVRLFKHRRLRDAIGLGLAFTMQGWACNYYKLFFATLLILIAPILFACLPRPRLAHLPWKGLLLSMAIAFVLFLPLDALQFINLQRTDTARAARIGALPHTSYWRTVPENLLYGWLFGESYVSYDDRYFLGLIPPLLAIIGLLALVPRIRRRAVAIEMSIDWRVLTPLLALGFFAFAFGCGKDLPTPWGDVPGPYNLLHNYIPGYQHTRVPSRFVMFVRVIVALLAAIGVVALLRSRWRGRVMRAALTAMALLIPLEHLAWPQPHWRISSGDRVPKAYHWLKTLPPGTPMLEFPPHSLNFRRWESWWMHLSTTHWLP